ncbi:MAG TPA: peptide deformylase [Actinomycetes bacterium]|nr:peptide deformylase [Actinomycetes bacterium]
MAVRPVLRLPAPALKAVARPVGDAVEAAAMAADLVDTMRAHDHCVGLAAPQIGVGLRAFCVDVTGHPKARSCAGLVVLLDPELVATGAPAVAREGCMSVPDLTGNLARPATVAVQGTTPEGATRLVEADAIEARALLHELDHLDGLLFLDRVVSASTDLFRRRRYR